MLKYKQIWHGIKPIRWLIKFNLTDFIIMTLVHIFRGRNSISCTYLVGESHRRDAYTQGEKTSFRRKPCSVCFTLCVFSCLFYGALSYIQYLYFVALIASYLCVRHAYILMLLYFIGCIFRQPFTLLYDHYSHFHMTVLCLIKLLICFTSCLFDCIFTCYIILILLLLVLP